MKWLCPGCSPDQSARAVVCPSCCGYRSADPWKALGAFLTAAHPINRRRKEPDESRDQVLDVQGPRLGLGRRRTTRRTTAGHLPRLRRNGSPMSLDDLWGPDPRIARLERELKQATDERQRDEIRAELEWIAEDRAMAGGGR